MPAASTMPATDPAVALAKEVVTRITTESAAWSVKPTGVTFAFLPLSTLRDLNANEIVVTVMPGLTAESSSLARRSTSREEQLGVRIALEAKVALADVDQQTALADLGERLAGLFASWRATNVDARETATRVIKRYDPASLRQKSLWCSVRELQFEAVHQ